MNPQTCQGSFVDSLYLIWEFWSWINNGQEKDQEIAEKNTQAHARSQQVSEAEIVDRILREVRLHNGSHKEGEDFLREMPKLRKGNEKGSQEPENSGRKTRDQRRSGYRERHHAAADDGQGVPEMRA